MSIDDIRLNCFQFLGFTNFDDVDWLLLPEYELLMQAHQLNEADAINKIALSAWWNLQVQATTGEGKNAHYTFKHLSDLYDYDAAVDKIRSAYNPDHQPVAKKEIQRSQAAIIAERSAEFDRMMSERNANHKKVRKGG